MKSLANKEVLLNTRERMLRLRADDKALWGQMTVGQMLRHVCLTDEMALGERIEPTKKGFPASIKLSIQKLIALWAPIPWPKSFGSPPGLIDPSPASLEDWLDRTVEKMEAVAHGIHFGDEHPNMGAMSPKDWQRCMYLHIDHHLRQFGR